MEGKSDNIDTSDSVKNTNKELIRACYTKNHKLLKKILSSKNVISSFFERWSTHFDKTALEIIFQKKDKEALRLFLDAYNNESKQLAKE